MKRRIAALLVLALGVSSAACARPARTASDAPNAKSIFFWRATKPGKPGTVFVLGSAHVRHAKAASLDRAITDAATACERGAFELDFDAVDNNDLAAFVQRDGVIPNGRTLRDVVSKETYEAWTKAVEARQMPREQLEHLQPWMAAMVLQLASLEHGGAQGSSADASGEDGVDRMLYAFEKQEPTRKRTIVGLESMLEQLGLFQKMSERGQDQLLLSAALGSSSGEDQKVLDLYERGDEAGVAQLFEDVRKEDPSGEEMMRAVIDQRNASMTDKVLPMFDSPGCSVVTVGAGHVVGAGGIVRRLEQKGYIVERVAPRGPTDSARMAFAVAAPKEFVSGEDGFAVKFASAPIRQDAPASGSNKAAHIYMFVEGVTDAVVVSVHDVPSDAARARMAKGLDEVVARALDRAGLQVTKTEPTEVQGVAAQRVLGVAKAAGSVRRGEMVAVLHGARLYTIMAIQMTDVGSEKLGPSLTAFLANFRFL